MLSNFLLFSTLLRINMKMYVGTSKRIYILARFDSSTKLVIYYLRTVHLYCLLFVQKNAYIYIYIQGVSGEILYIKMNVCMFVCLFVCTLYKSTFLNRSEPNFAHISPVVWKRL